MGKVFDWSHATRGPVLLYIHSRRKNNWQLLSLIKNKCDALEPEATVTSLEDLTTHWTIWNSPL